MTKGQFAGYKPINHKLFSYNFISNYLGRDNIYFPVVVWLLSRLLIWAGMLLIAPNIPITDDSVFEHGTWSIFDAWDSVHYRAIATSGYEFYPDGQQYNLAFFPMFPLTIWVLMKLGLPFEIAGLLINNLSFLGAVYLLYFWVKKHCSLRIAQWTIIVICCCPMSMFTGVIYTEGLYLLFSIGCLRAFDEEKYSLTAFWGAMATATRPTGMALIPALLLTAWRQRRGKIAYFTSLLTATGLILFSIYCAINFHDPLAFIAAQKGWRPSLGFDWQGWLNMLMQIILGRNWNFGWVWNDDGGIRDPWYPVFFGFMVYGTVTLWLRQKYWHPFMIYLVYTTLAVLLILVDQRVINNLLNVLMVVGGSYLVWHFRRKLTPVMVIYSLCGVGLLLASGGTISLSRLAYGIVPLSIAIGAWLSRFPRQAYLSVGLFVVLLFRLAIGFAQHHWVG